MIFVPAGYIAGTERYRFKNMNKLCRNALASCLTVSIAVGSGIAVPAASTASLEQDTAVAGMAVSLDNYYSSSQTPEADIMDYIRYIVAAAKEKKAIPVITVNAVTKEDGSVVFGTNLVSKDASEKEEGLVSVMASLNVRSKPSASSSVLGYLYSNCVVSIYDTVENDEGSWYLIKSGDVEGYVSSNYVLTGSAAKASEEDLTNRYAKVTAKSATVYNSASKSADSVGTVYVGGDYKVLEIQNGFVKIEVNDEFAGYVRSKDVSLYTRHAEAVALNDQMVKNQLDSYLVDIRDAEAIFEKRMAVADYQAAYNASTYAYELWNYYINDASNAGYTDLVANAKNEQKKTADMVARATAALNGQTLPETSTAEETTTTMQEQQTTTQEQTSPSQSETEPTAPTTVEDTTTTTVENTTSTTAEETTTTTVENTTSTTAEETTTTTVENTTSTTAEETTTTTVEDTTSTTASEAVKTIQNIEAYYTGSGKTEGSVISASEIYIVVTYTDGTTQTLTEGWNCDQVGMKLSAGQNIITVTYQGFSSSFELNAATVEPSSDVPTSSTPAENSSETQPDTPAPSSEEETTTTTTAEETTPTTAEETTPTTVEETTTTTAAETTTTTAEETTTTQEITTPSNSSTPLRDAVVNYALSWVGQCNYVYGGANLSVGGSVDCSGFTMQVYSRVAGVSLPHHSMSQMNYGSAITYDQLRPGDLVFYNNPNHVAIYIGNGAIVHAGSPETGINVTSVFFKTPIGYRTYLP